MTNGLSHFLEHMLFRGTTSHPSSFLFNQAIESLGGNLDAATYVDVTEYNLSLPPENWEPILEVFAGMFQRPRLQGLDRERSVIEEEILEELDEHGNDINVDNLARAAMFAPDALGHKIIGSSPNVRRFTVDDMQAHLAQYYNAQNMIIGVAGPLAPAQVLISLERCFASVRRGKRCSPPALQTPSHARGSLAYVENVGSQTDVRQSFVTVGARDAESTALQAIVRILDGGLSSRLQQRVADELGLAYHVFAGYDPYEDCGVLDFGASVQHRKAASIISEFGRVIDEFCQGAVTPKEVETVKQRFVWDVYTALDDCAAMASLNCMQALTDNSLGLEPVLERIASLSKDAIQRVAASTFDKQNMVLACVGMLEPDEIDTLESLLK